MDSVENEVAWCVNIVGLLSVFDCWIELIFVFPELRFAAGISVNFLSGKHVLLGTVQVSWMDRWMPTCLSLAPRNLDINYKIYERITESNLGSHQQGCWT